MTAENEVNDHLTPEDADVLLEIARRSLELYVRDGIIYHPDLSKLPGQLTDLGASFVTITNHGKLRGCMGNTEPKFALARDVARNAVSAASRDYRFPSVQSGELAEVRLEVTVLSVPEQLPYQSYDELVHSLNPGVHGVILSSGMRKGLLLPQVWDRLPDPHKFLEMIALKAAISADELGDSPPTVEAYTFEAHHYSETGYLEPGG